MILTPNGYLLEAGHRSSRFVDGYTIDQDMAGHDQGTGTLAAFGKTFIHHHAVESLLLHKGVGRWMFYPG